MISILFVVKLHFKFTPFVSRLSITKKKSKSYPLLIFSLHFLCLMPRRFSSMAMISSISIIFSIEWIFCNRCISFSLISDLRDYDSDRCEPLSFL